MNFGRRNAFPKAQGVLLLSFVLSHCVATSVPVLRTDLPAGWSNRPTAVPAPSRDPRSWWQVFGDETLDSLIKRSLAENLDVRQAEERLRAAHALYRRRDAQFFPELHARTVDVIDPDASSSVFVSGLDAVWQFGVAGRRTATDRVAGGELGSAEASLEEVRLALAGEVARTWMELRFARGREGLLTQIRDRRQQREQLIAKRLQLRLSSTQAGHQAGAALAESESDLTVPRQDAIAASWKLAALLGQPAPDPQWMTQGGLPKLGSWTLATVPADLLRSRPDILRAEAHVIKAAGELGLARANRYPSVAIAGSIGWPASLTSHPGAAIGGLAPVVDIPLFDWGMRKAAEEAKADELRAAVLAYRQSVLASVTEVEIALGRLEQQRLNEELLEHALTESASVALQTATRERLGLASAIDSTDRDIERDQAALKAMAARFAHDLAFIELYRALGGARLAERDSKTAPPFAGDGAH